MAARRNMRGRRGNPVGPYSRPPRRNSRPIRRRGNLPPSPAPHPSGRRPRRLPQADGRFIRGPYMGPGTGNEDEEFWRRGSAMGPGNEDEEFWRRGSAYRRKPRRPGHVGQNPMSRPSGRRPFRGRR